MIRNAWRIPGGVGAAANTANRRVLVTNKDGSQQVVTVNNELGMRAGDKGDIRSRLAKQGVDTENIDLYGGMDTRDKAKKPLDKVFASALRAKAKTVVQQPLRAHDPTERFHAAVKLAAAFRV